MVNFPYLCWFVVFVYLYSCLVVRGHLRMFALPVLWIWKSSFILVLLFWLVFKNYVSSSSSYEKYVFFIFQNWNISCPMAMIISDVLHVQYLYVSNYLKFYFQEILIKKIKCRPSFLNPVVHMHIDIL